jgi:hypothetical protein
MGKRESSEINFLNAPKSNCKLLKNEFKLRYGLVGIHKIMFWYDRLVNGKKPSLNWEGNAFMF